MLGELETDDNLILEAIEVIARHGGQIIVAQLDALDLGQRHRRPGPIAQEQLASVGRLKLEAALDALELCASAQHLREQITCHLSSRSCFWGWRSTPARWTGSHGNARGSDGLAIAPSDALLPDDIAILILKIDAAVALRALVGCRLARLEAEVSHLVVFVILKAETASGRPAASVLVLGIASGLAVAALGLNAAAGFQFAYLAKSAMIVACAATLEASPVHALFVGIQAVVVTLAAGRAHLAREIAMRLRLRAVRAAHAAPGNPAVAVGTTLAAGPAVVVNRASRVAMQVRTDHAGGALHIADAAELAEQTLVTEVGVGAI